MKLYYSKGACSLASNISLREAGIDFDLIHVNLGTHTTESGEDYYTINPKGYVPALKLEDNTLLTEGVAILEYIADRNKETKLAPEHGTMERYHLVEWLTYISSEIHKNFSPLFDPTITEEARTTQISRLMKRIPLIEETLSKNTFLTGDTFTIADAYIYTVLRWNVYLKVDISIYPNILKFMEKVTSRRSVQEALTSEGLI